LKIQYRINGKAGEASLPENAAIMLPIPKWLFVVERFLCFLSEEPRKKRSAVD